MKLYSIKIKIGYIVYSPIVWFINFLKNNYQKNISFYNGIPYFHKTRKSKIIIGKNCRFNSRTTSNLIGINHKCMICTLSKDAVLLIGNNCGFSGTTIGCFELIQIGNNVRFGANSMITDSDWHNDDPRSGGTKPVIIEDNVWIGYGSIILKGVKIGKNSVIGAGSVVTKNIPPNVIAAGNPCITIKTISEI